MKATWQGQVIADSDAALEVGGYHYFPRTSVRIDLLRAAPKTAADHQCPHGVQFYDVVDARHTSPRNAWSYEKPGSAMQTVGHWIGFWDEVEVE